MSIPTLVVDDSPMARKLIRHHLEQVGCKVVAEAENGAQALAMFRELHPQLVTLDVMMSSAEGVDSLCAFRTIKRESPDTAVVVVSAVPFEKTRDTFVREGALAYIIKPFNRFSFEQVRMKLNRFFPELVAH